MADNAYEQLTQARKQIAAEKARADAAQVSLYDGYLRAVLAGLCQRYEFDTSPQNLMEQADRLTIAALRARERYKAGLSPNVPPTPQLKKDGPK